MIDEPAKVKLVPEGATIINMTEPPLTLLKRLQKIQKEIEVEITGSFQPTANAAKRPALSIGDVDKALGKKFAEHGVLSDYTFAKEPAPVESGRLWMVNLLVKLRNVDDGSDTIEATIYDIGSNISAAVSFALKRYYRALFKLVEDDDQVELRIDSPRAAPQVSEPAPSIPVASTWSVDQERILTKLRDSLPNGESPFSWSMIQKQSYDTAMKILTKKHETQCWGKPESREECVRVHLAVA